MVFVSSRLLPYGCLSTGHRVGFIEIVRKSETIANIQKERSGRTKLGWDSGVLYTWLKEKNPTEPQYVDIINTYTCPDVMVMCVKACTYMLHQNLNVQCDLWSQKAKIFLCPLYIGCKRLLKLFADHVLDIVLQRMFLVLAIDILITS